MKQTKIYDILDAKVLGLIDTEDIIIGKPRFYLIDYQMEYTYALKLSIKIVKLGVYI